MPLLVIVGDEDDLCLDGSLFLKRTVPTAALLVVPRAGHTINSEEPAAVNAALAELFAAADAGRWLAHKPARRDDEPATSRSNRRRHRHAAAAQSGAPQCDLDRDVGPARRLRGPGGARGRTCALS